MAQRLVAGLPAQRLEFFSKLVRVGFVVDNFVSTDLDFPTSVSLHKCSTLIFLSLTKANYNLRTDSAVNKSNYISLYSPASTFLRPN